VQGVKIILIKKLYGIVYNLFEKLYL
jgi:hypothetical protein